jgi:hypothetical protein
MKIDSRAIECFEAWSKKPPEEEIISAEDFLTDDALTKQITRGPKKPATVLSIKCLPLKLQELLSGKMQEFGSVEIIGDGRNICLKKAKIWKLTVRDVRELNFSDCEIGEIAVHHTASYRVKDSKIGKFVVVLEKADKPYRGYHVQDLKWEGGYARGPSVKGLRTTSPRYEASDHPLKPEVMRRNCSKVGAAR